jgi:hypothetical protein
LVPTTKMERLMMSREAFTVYCENHTKHTNAECRVFRMLKEAVRRVTAVF